MAGVFKLVFAQDFLATSTIVVTHNLDLAYLKVRVIDSTGIVINEKIDSIVKTNGNERNELTVNLTSTDTGRVQLLSSDMATTGGVEAIDDLNDVDTTTTTPANGDALTWDGSNWIPGGGFTGTPGNTAYAIDTGSQSIVNTGTFQGVNFGINILMTDWVHAPGTSVFTCPADGWYSCTFEFNVEKSGGGSPVCNVKALFNGAEVQGSHNGMDVTSNNTSFALSRTFMFEGTASQDLEIQIAGSSTTLSLVPAPANGPVITAVSAVIIIRKA